MRVLVTAASRHDATRGIAEAIATGLARRGVEARMLPMDQVHSLSCYDAVVVGSAVYVGRWLRPAVAFVSAHSARLVTMPVWLFSSGPLGPPERRIPATGPADVDEMTTLAGARAHRVFGGCLERARLGIGERAMVRAVGAPYGDERDWGAIDGYAAEIAAALDRIGCGVH